MAGTKHGLDGRDADAAFTLPGATSHYPPDLTLAPVHLDVALTVSVPDETAAGRVTHTLRAACAGVREVVLHAVDLDIESAVDPSGAELVHAYDGRELRVTWAREFSAGEERDLAITYRVERPVAGLYFSHPSPDYPDAAEWAATDHETERARHWLPTIDLPNARPTLAFHLRADARYTILANGAEAGEEVHDDGTKTVHWTLEQPCPSYLTCFAIGDFTTYDDGDFEGRPVRYFTTPAFAPEDLQRAFGRTKEMLDWMSGLLDFAFPYPKYFQFALPSFGGAMENISLVSWDDQFVLDETLGREWKRLVDEINVHEMAHSYFGDMIVCRDYAHAWLKESWATYVEALWFEHDEGEDSARYQVWSNIDAYAKESAEAYMRPIVTRTFNHSWQMYDRHLYPGGAARLHMLRKELGDDVFFAGVRAYVKRFAHQVVETSDFRRALEEASGRSLGRWFDQWIHRKGLPRLKATYRYDAKAAQIEIGIEQTQIDPKGGVGVFEMPLDLAWIVEGEMHVRTVELTRAKHVFAFPLANAPSGVRIDPTTRSVLKLEFNPGDEMLRVQLREAKDAVGRILAAQELCRTGRRQNLEAVRSAYEQEAFFGCRLRFAEALAGAGTQAAVEAMAHLVDIEQDPLVLEGLLRSAGRLRAPEIQAAIRARLDAGLDLYRARQAAYEGLGAQREAAPYERLVAGVEDADPYGLAEMGAYRALAASRRPEALDVLLSRTQPGRTTIRARPTAATAAGTLARHLDRPTRERVLEALVDRLRDENERVRLGALAGLRMLREPGAIPALQAFRSGLGDQLQINVDRAVQALRKAATPKLPDLDKQLDELRETVRKLEARLEKLE